MTFVDRPTVHDGESTAANDNNTPAPDPESALDQLLLADDDKIAELVRRTERLGVLVVVAMAIGLIFVPALCVALSHGI